MDEELEGPRIEFLSWLDSGAREELPPPVNKASARSGSIEVTVSGKRARNVISLSPNLLGQARAQPGAGPLIQVIHQAVPGVNLSAAWRLSPNTGDLGPAEESA